MVLVAPKGQVGKKRWKGMEKTDLSRGDSEGEADTHPRILIPPITEGFHSMKVALRTVRPLALSALLLYPCRWVSGT